MEYMNFIKNYGYFATHQIRCVNTNTMKNYIKGKAKKDSDRNYMKLNNGWRK